MTTNEVSSGFRRAADADPRIWDLYHQAKDARYLKGSVIETVFKEEYEQQIDSLVGPGRKDPAPIDYLLTSACHREVKNLIFFQFSSSVGDDN